jgi:hypothetical protein
MCVTTNVIFSLTLSLRESDVDTIFNAKSTTTDINQSLGRETKQLTVVYVSFFLGIDANSRRFRTDFLQEWPTPGTGPYFDTSIPSNITGLVGKTVHLICKVKNLGNRTVSEIHENC